MAEISSLSVVGENRVNGSRYEPSGSIRPILESLKIDLREYGFVDYGSGKGRVLLEASEFPFRLVEGVEFSPQMHEIATRNIRKYRWKRKRCVSVKSVLADATQFALPAIPLVLFFFNPFTGPVLSAVVSNIRESAINHPRDIVIIAAGSWMPQEEIDEIANLKMLSKQGYRTVYRLGP
ncbi:MAG: class I SAM-dependent methyltransferase [Terracidiphilus sp.]|jgi:SAM-dependent methyltransferase